MCVKNIMKYTLTLTGAPDATTDVLLPISSFSLRLRDSTKDSYLSCVVPNVSAYSALIAARPNGNLILTGDWTLITCPITDIREQKGAQSSSITLTGYATISNPVPTSHTVETAFYTNNDPTGSFRIRTPVIQALPDDTLIYQSVSRTIESISLSVNANQTQMEHSCV